MYQGFGFLELEMGSRLVENEKLASGNGWTRWIQRSTVGHFRIQTLRKYVKHFPGKLSVVHVYVPSSGSK